MLSSILTSQKNYAEYIDQTVLNADATVEDVKRLCIKAHDYQFAAICVNSVYLPLARRLLDDSEVKLCGNVGFPLGATLPSMKSAEARQVIDAGANEVDMVLHVGSVIDGRYDLITNEVKEVAAAVRGHCLKVILEICLLTDEQIVKASRACLDAGADFIKTSTGFGQSGATIHAVRLMKEAVSGKIAVKAAGGIKDADFFLKLIAAGADRIGTSSGDRILDELQRRGM